MNRTTETLKKSKITIACVGLVVLSIVAYLYFLNISVVHVVMRKEASFEKNQLRTEIAMLETDYIEAQHTITARMATLENYSDDASKIFITRANTNLVLRDN